MKKFASSAALALTFAVGGSMAAPLFAANPAIHQDRDHDQANRDDSAYTNNRYYKQGWQEGQKHKHKKHKFKNDDDRQAYEAGYGHGDRGEQWRNSQDRDHRDNDHRDNDHHDQH